jgi:hypothetical protein
MPVFERTVDFFTVLGIEGIQAVEYNQNMYAFGGYNGAIYGNATYRTPNGQDVTVVNFGDDATSFTRRAHHRAVVHDGKIALVGGYNGAAALSDVWLYDNGWTRVCTNFGNTLYGHALYSYDNRLFVVGGTDGTTEFGDCWASYDGTNWRRLVTGYSVLQRAFAGYCVYDNKMWLIGGWDGTATISDSYCSVNGITWERQEVPADFPALCGHTVTVFDNKMVLIGGGTAYDQRTISGVGGNLWYSFHGAEWIRGADDLEFSRAFHAAFAYTDKQRLIVTCGTDGVNRYADIWQTRGCEFLNRAW